MFRKLGFIALFLHTLHAQDTIIIDSQEEWTKHTEINNTINISEGYIKPTDKEAAFSSTLIKQAKKRKLQSILFEQSPVWLNWQPTANIGTRDMRDAPVMISIEKGNYWMFAKYSGSGKRNKNFKPKKTRLEGFDIELLTTPVKNQFQAPGGLKKSTGGYHAWQSKDMVNWVHHGSITDKFAKWMTTAEYVDGKFYFYYDFPNDQDPHVYVDDDLTDGKPGKNMGLAFKDPSDGSDCTIFRDKDGQFHLIYEDWSPIKASARAWDSPLAGHAVSQDGLSDFKIIGNAVDERTTPTGVFKTYTHPHWVKEDKKNFPSNVVKYEVHKPMQAAYGDWASIKVGDQYYLFCDNDPVHAKGEKVKMSTAWFTSNDLNGKFKYCGHIGEGHPDPDICFAEGKFYLATQQNDDYISDGPWVETVEVRVGVDTSNNGKINKWTEWSQVKENYNHTPGFVKHVQKTPAKLKVDTLPEGYNFKFEVKITDSTENDAKPILDKVTLEFKN